jgi:catechol 2,3-dioxygenase-like lactoylglutathione lyase family enzyme
MLEKGTMVGFLVTTDYDRARAFYEQKLGFQFVSVDQFALVMSTGKNMIRINKNPDFNAAHYTVLGWEVSDIEAAVLWLMERDVAFEDYSFIQNHELRIWMAPDGSKVAWLKDPDGNVLSISQHV